jgi:hypothetical protein
MNLSLKFAVIVAALFLEAFGSGVAADQESYPLKVRGGGKLTIANDGRGCVRIQFEAAPGPYGDGLEPGQASWADRALNKDEPTIICDTAKSASEYVGKLVRRSEYVILQVYNDGKGCLKVTRVGP